MNNVRNINDELSGRILVVDDSELIVKLIRNYLNAEKFKTYTAFNGKDALNLLDEPLEFDLVVLDVMLPDISGFDVCRTLRNRFSLYELPVLFLTGLKEIVNILEGFEAGGNDYLIKPFNSQEFLIRAKTLIKLKKLTQANEALQDAVQIKNRAVVQLQHEIAFRLKIEKELILAKEQADMANSLKSEFLANMSHEIRTPMNAIMGFSEMLRKYLTDEKGNKYLDSIIASSKNLLVIINDILDLSKIEAGKINFEPEPINLKYIIMDIYQVFQLKLVEKSLNFDMVIDDRLPSNVMLDEARIRQILLNLIGNAIKFTNKGTVGIKVMTSEISNLNKRLNLKIDVHDTGIGIPKEQHDLIFEAFTQQTGQSSKSFGGTGLGLTITKRLVEMMGGNIFLSSVPGTGSTFSVVFSDLAYEDRREDESTQLDYDDVSKINFHPANLLIVDDVQANLDLIWEYLADTEINVSTLSDPKNLIDTIRNTSPDIILMDLKMPHIDGYQAKKMISNYPEFNNVPILAMTAYAMLRDKEKIMKEGFNGIILKPVKRDDLILELSSFLPYYLGTKSIDVTDIKEVESADESIVNFSEMIKKLENLLTNEYASAIKSYRIGNIKFFAENLFNIADKHASSFLRKLAVNILNQCDELDMKNLKQTLSQFHEIINNYKKNNE